MVIYAIPGLGTTEKLYANTKINGVEIVVLKWPVPDKKDTMNSYAKKFLPQIKIDIPFCLLGVSFGGMLCVELSKLISPLKTFLISSCKSRKELPWFIKALKHVPLHQWISEKKHRQMAYNSGALIGFGKAYIPEYLGMIDSMCENYFKYCIHIITHWENQETPDNCVHIHGASDRLLNHKKVKTNYLITNGSHAMIVFQAEEICRIIEKEIQKI